MALPLADAPGATPTTPTTPTTLRRVRAIAVGCVLALIVLGLAWELWLAPTGNRTLALKVLPLAAALAGLMRHRMYTYRWLSLLVWIYFAEGVVRAASERGPAAHLALAEVVLSSALFAACIWHVRWRQRQAAGVA